MASTPNKAGTIAVRQQPRQPDALGHGEFRGRHHPVRRQAQTGMKHFVRVVGHWGLLLHIYISMAGFTLVLLFAMTGLTLNHEDFGLSQPKITKSTIALPADVLEHPDRRPSANAFERCSGFARRSRIIARIPIRFR